MPKRDADDYITKENGSLSNYTDGDDTPKMSTAAQLAKRKYAQFVPAPKPPLSP